MSKAILPVIAAALVLTSGTLFSASSSAQSVPSRKVAASLAPLFGKPQKAPLNQTWPDVFAMAVQVYLSGKYESNDRYAKGIPFSEAIDLGDRSIEELNVLKGIADSRLATQDQLVHLAKRLELQEVQ